ncbi:extensin family protein [Rhizobium halophytocola]|uniref:Lectin-like protein BA14k n=1 Tax=Rhizobium halophytocola TaxID=735519 RepID=A0ABS4E5Y1_9HYPH|nr:extensin family protein [Rhizobium halophytocola]MBP1853342.1 hypothetical protein [Rhizobium halophytocola]
MRQRLELAMVVICLIGLTGVKLPRKGPLPAPRPDITETARPQDQTPSAPEPADDTDKRAETPESGSKGEKDAGPAELPADIPPPVAKPQTLANDAGPANSEVEDAVSTNASEPVRQRAARADAEHKAWCKARYKSYDEKTDSYRSFSGRVRPCLSPAPEPPPPTPDSSTSDNPDAAKDDAAEATSGKVEDRKSDEAAAKAVQDDSATDNDGKASSDDAKKADGEKTGDDKSDTEKPAPPPPPPPIEDENLAAYGACIVELKKLGAEFAEEPRIDGGNGCGIDKPIKLSRVLPGISVSPAATVRCETALELARMTRDFVIPAAKVGLSGKPKLTSINQASSYVCRNRDSLADAKMSEHAKGNAIDIASLSFGKTTVPMRIIEPKESTIEASFQRAIDKIACLFFSTVLAPGADVYHKDHMHLDVIHRSSGYRICQ